MNNGNNKRLDTYRVAAFAAPSFVTSLIHGPMAGILPALIVKFFGVEMAVMSTILLVSRVFDGVSDPMIGILSDRTHTSIGRRKPWIIAGALLTMLAVYFLFMPNSNVGAVYFLIWLIIISLGWTMMEIPYAAWLSEITRDYDERTRIQTYRVAFVLMGSLLFAVAPLLPIFESKAMTPEVLRFVGKVILVITLPFVIAAVMLNHNGKSVAVREALSIKDLFFSIKSNRPLLSFIAFNICFGFANGMIMALFFPILDSYLMIGDKFSHIMIPTTIAAFIAMPMWLKIISLIDKHRALVLSGFLAIIIHFTFLLLKPGPESFIPFLLQIVGIQIVFGAYMVAPMPILADIIDYDILKTGSNRAAQYSSVYTLLLKLNAAVSAALAYFLLSRYGYDISTTTHSPEAIAGLRMTYVYVPMTFAVIGTTLAWFFPINAKRQKIIQKRIEMLAERKARKQANNQQAE